jgi:long-chain fatty acid transport protein
VDVLGALFWNPATLGALKQSELSFGGEMLFAHPTVSSRVAANALGRGVPPVLLAGSTDSDSAGDLVPDIGLAHHIGDTPFTFGLGLLTAGGFSSNYPASLTNPILTPQAPRGVGFGNISAELQVYQMVPALSVQLTDNLYVGISPMIDLTSLRADPLILVPPDDANRDGFPTFPNGEHAPFHAGAGFQAGVYLTTEAGWNFGASLKSKQWFEKFRFNTTDELGRPRADSVRFEFPLIASLGVSYSGLEHWLFASDARYIDYRHASPFGKSGFTPQGAVNGIGWDSIFVLTAGVQYEVSERLTARIGYSFNTNPEANDVAIFNVGAPTIIQHTLYAGGSWKFSENLVGSVSYAHAFENSIEGPYVLPQGVIPGTSVKSTVSADAITVGFSVLY